ncbi:MAG: hypothetical protein ACU843_05075 [Gammaproteobacteria bacterium]
MKTAIKQGLAVFLVVVWGLQAVAAAPGGLDDPPVWDMAPSGANVLGPIREAGPMVVQAAFYLQDLDEINDEKRTVEFTGFLTLKWQDKRQAFDPDEAGVDEKIYQGNFQFNELSPAWYPQVVLANQSGRYEKQAVLLRVQADGTSLLVESVNAVAEAHLDLGRHPFDRQRLEAIFEVLGFNSSEVVLEALPTPVFDTSRDFRVPGWKLTNLTTSSREIAAPYAGTPGIAAAFVLTMDVERESLFMLRLVVFPLVVIVMLSWSVFWMDRSALGERMDVSFIGILTAVAYQNVVSENLPQISFLTWTNAFVTISFLIMCATVVIHLVVDGLDKRGQSERGDLIDRRCRWVFPVVYFGLLFVATAIAFIFL